jgi:uncharacterized protein (TIGR00730 family)
MTVSFSLCVYCGSRTGDWPPTNKPHKLLANGSGQRKGQLVYGGGNSGLMGVVASATQQAGGQVVGIIPRSLAEKELARDDCDEFYLVDTMHQRKHMMAERADAFLALPGGIGTFEEFFEVWTWRQLGYHNKPDWFTERRWVFRWLAGIHATTPFTATVLCPTGKWA